MIMEPAPHYTEIDIRKSELELHKIHMRNLRSARPHRESLTSEEFAVIIHKFNEDRKRESEKHKKDGTG